MKKYIILTPNVCGMGGAELYILRRSKHLKERGFDVFVFVAFHKQYFPLKEDFDGVSIHVVPELLHYSSSISLRSMENVVDTIVNTVGEASDIFIESHTLSTIEWGEIIANKCKGKHLGYLLAEPPISGYRFNPGKKIFNYKLNKGQLYGCSNMSLKIIFQNMNVPDNYVNIGFDESELEDKCSPALNINKGNEEFVIATVGRLDKPYIEPLIENVISFAKTHKETKIMLLVAGGSLVAGCEERLRNKYNNDVIRVDNLNVVFTGYIEKLGRDFFQIADVFVGLGTASINAISQRCVTINIDPSDRMEKSSGFFGTDTKNFAYADSGVLYNLNDKLEECLIANADKIESIKDAGLQLYNEQFKTGACLEKLDRIFNNIEVSNNSNIIRVTALYRFYVRLGLAIYKYIKKQRAI